MSESNKVDSKILFAAIDFIGYSIVIRTMSSEKYDDACRELRKAGFFLG